MISHIINYITVKELLEIMHSILIQYEIEYAVNSAAIRKKTIVFTFILIFIMCQALQ